jgi:hypothetical protein
MEQMDSDNEHLGTKHWLFQTVPPLLMLTILVFTKNGSSLVFLAGFFILPVLISFISILVKLIRFKKRKYFLLRPILTIAIFMLILFVAHWTYNTAKDQAVEAAKIIHEECNKNLICPTHPDDWEVEDTRITRNDFGFWFKYVAFYTYDPVKLKIRLYRGPDIGMDITGGVNLPFISKPHVENEY